MSFLNTSHSTVSTQPIPAHISKSQALEFLHTPDLMMALNPLVTGQSLLPATALPAFYKNEAPAHRAPADEVPYPVYKVTESTSSTSGESNGSWRGGWAKRFIPDEIAYEMSMQNTDDGLISVTHAPMGVHNVTVWKIMDEEEAGKGCSVEERGTVSSNRMLMGFIKTTMQESHDTLVANFVKALEKWAADAKGA